MTPSLPQSVLDAADISAITQIILTERESRDLGRWDDMRACFYPDSRVRISWFTGNGHDFVEGSKDMARRQVLAKHRLGPIRVRLSGDRAVASLVGIIDIPAKAKGLDVMLSSQARFLYPAERRDGRWGLMGFYGIYMCDAMSPVVPGQSLVIPPAELEGFRASYRMLSWVLSSQGYVVNSEMPGEDLPETGEALFRELFDWAGIR
jgi:hypothetical protein